MQVVWQPYHSSLFSYQKRGQLNFMNFHSTHAAFTFIVALNESVPDTHAAMLCPLTYIFERGLRRANTNGGTCLLRIDVFGDQGKNRWSVSIHSVIALETTTVQASHSPSDDLPIWPVLPVSSRSPV